MKRLIVILLSLFVLCAFMLVACNDTAEETDTTEEETTEEETTEEETTEEETTLPETTVPETTAPETVPETESVIIDDSEDEQHWYQIPQEVSGGGSLLGGSENANGGTLTSNGTVSNSLSTGSTSYVDTNSGRQLVHTYSDRAADPYEDNSTSIAYMPMKSSTVFTDPYGIYNVHQVLVGDIKPGLICNGVLVGYDGYMFYQDTLNDFIGSGFLSQTVYDKAIRVMRERNNWCVAHGKKFYFVIAPNKNTVYPDYMPDGYTLASYRRYDQFVTMLQDAGITAVDLRGAMAAAVAENPERNLYYKYDTHWNNHAGLIAYNVTMNMIRQDYPNAVLHTKSEYQINYCETYMKDQAYYLGYYDYFTDYGPVYTLKSGRTATLANYTPRQGWGQFAFAYEWPDGFCDKLYYLQYQNNYNTGAPSAYIMRDSYSIAMIPFLKDSFYRSTYNWTFAFSEQEILNSGSDIVMVIVAERNLKSYINQKAVAD